MKNLKFDSKTIDYSQVMQLGKLVFEFVKKTNGREFLKNTDWGQGDQQAFYKLFSDIPTLVFSSEENTNAFLEIVYFCKKENIEDENKFETILETIELVSEVSNTNFFQKLTIMFVNLTRG